MSIFYCLRRVSNFRGLSDSNKILHRFVYKAMWVDHSVAFIVRAIEYKDRNRSDLN